MKLFERAVSDLGIPSRIRTDKGGENVMIWEYMENERGPNRESYLAASSVHNQRIKRLWRDVEFSVLFILLYFPINGRSRYESFCFIFYNHFKRNHFKRFHFVRFRYVVRRCFHL